MSATIAILIVSLAIFGYFWLRRLPMLLVDVATKLEKRCQYTQQERVLKWALKVARLTDSPRPGWPRKLTPLLHVMDRLGTCYLWQHKYKERAAIDREQFELLTQAGDHVYAADIAGKMSVDHMYTGDYDTALAMSQRALASLKSVYENSLAETASAMEKLQVKVHRAQLANAFFTRAWILEVLRRFDEALAFRKQALELMEAHYGSTAYQITPHLNRLGELYIHLGRLADAEPLLKRCYQIRKSSNSSETLICSSQESVGLWHLHSGNLDEAAKDIEHSYSRLKAIRHLPDNAILADSIVPIAELRMAQKRFGEAQTMLRAAVEHMQEDWGKDNPLLLDALELLESCLREKTADAADVPAGTAIHADEVGFNPLNERAHIETTLAQIKARWNITAPRYAPAQARETSLQQ